MTNIINAKGEKESFSPRKVYQSARRAGASKPQADKIVKEVEKKLYPDKPTSKIFSEVKSFLNRENPKSGIRFNLKKAMKDLGPTGFPFEKYIKGVFSERGYKTKVNQNIKGKCLVHEIDFLAEKGGFIYIGECKYRNRPKDRVHSGDALMNYARFLDIKKGSFLKKEIKSILVTNTKFTKRSEKYSRCVGVELLGWRWPRNKGLEYYIESQELYPITILPSFNKRMAEAFSREKKMLANDVLKIDLRKFAKRYNLPYNRMEKLSEEAKILL